MAITRSKELKKLNSVVVVVGVADTAEWELIILSIPAPLVDNIILMSMTIVEPYTTQTANLLSHCLTTFSGPNIQKRIITAPKTIDQM